MFAVVPPFPPGLYRVPVAPKQRGTEGVRNFVPAALIAARTSKKWTHDAFAEVVGIGRPHLIAYEKGRRRPSPERLLQLATALNVDPLALTSATLQTATLADLRVRLGLSVTTLTGRLGIPRSTYLEIELGSGAMTPAIRTALAEHLKVSARSVGRAYKRGVAHHDH
jgi:transcriptional regulator with XRE-family HTH domain